MKNIWEKYDSNQESINPHKISDELAALFGVDKLKNDISNILESKNKEESTIKTFTKSDELELAGYVWALDKFKKYQTTEAANDENYEKPITVATVMEKYEEFELAA